MQNKGNCGWDQGFVPVNGNWDFNMDGDCGCQQTNAGCRNRRRNGARCSGCEAADNCAANQQDCRCERCGDTRRVICCEENTYIRRDGCEAAAYVCGEGQNRTGCTGNADCQCEDCMRNRSSCRQHSCSERRTCTGDAACQCEDCVRSRRRSSDCEVYRDNNACGSGRADGYASGYDGKSKNRRVGMVNVDKQEIDKVFESESALRAGTLFPELHKPMNGYCPRSEHCCTRKQAAAFAAWEMRLYLNTHPNDQEALALFGKLCREAEEENYATAFLPDACGTNGWTWPGNPWPWEYDCRCGD